MSDNLLTIPRDAGRAIIEAGAIIACPLLGTDKFITFCRKRGVTVNRERLLRLERLRMFAPVFRVRTPKRQMPSFHLPPQENNNWFDNGCAWDTSSSTQQYQVPAHNDRTQEGYYSVFQIDYLSLVLSDMTQSVHMDSYLEHSSGNVVNWASNGERWLKYTRAHASSLQAHQHRRAVALLCQFISNRYYPQGPFENRSLMGQAS